MGNSTRQEVVPKSAPDGRVFSGWWWALASLPAALSVQLALSDSEFGEALALAFDLLALVRIFIGLGWQRRSADWFVYCLLPYAVIPVAWLVEIVMHRHH